MKIKSYRNMDGYTERVRLCKLEVLESAICDVIKIRLKRRIALRSWKGNQLLNIKTAVELQF